MSETKQPSLSDAASLLFLTPCRDIPKPVYTPAGDAWHKAYGSRCVWELRANEEWQDVCNSLGRVRDALIELKEAKEAADDRIGNYAVTLGIIDTKTAELRDYGMVFERDLPDGCAVVRAVTAAQGLTVELDVESPRPFEVVEMPLDTTGVYVHQVVVQGALPGMGADLNMSSKGAADRLARRKGYKSAKLCTKSAKSLVRRHLHQFILSKTSRPVSKEVPDEEAPKFTDEELMQWMADTVADKENVLVLLEDESVRGRWATWIRQILSPPDAPINQTCVVRSARKGQCFSRYSIEESNMRQSGMDFKEMVRELATLRKAGALTYLDFAITPIQGKHRNHCSYRRLFTEMPRGQDPYAENQ